MASENSMAQMGVASCAAVVLRNCLRTGLAAAVPSLPTRAGSASSPAAKERIR